MPPSGVFDGRTSPDPTEKGSFRRTEATVIKMKRVVVTGLGTISPVGHSVAETWASLIAGVNGIAPITYFPTDDIKYKLAAQIKDYNPTDFLDKMTARKTDLFVQYALIATEEAMNDSGIAGNVEPERLAVYYGSGVGGFNTMCSEHEALLSGGPRRVSPHFIPKMISNIAAGNIAIKYGAHADCVAVSTACASGTTAVGEAYRLISGGYADAAICGGSEAAITPLTVAGFGNCQALTASEDVNAASIPFDKRRSGFVLGEGAGTLILEEYSHAVARGANIYAEVCGYGSTCDAHHVTAPDPGAAMSAKAIADALKDVAYEPEKLYINAHGTSTPLNDRTETAAIKKALGESNASKIHMSSTKSMTGHMLGAAGALEAIAAIKAICGGIVPPTINYLEKDEDCDLDCTPNKAVSCEITTAASTSLGFGGHNACVAFKKID